MEARWEPHDFLLHPCFALDHFPVLQKLRGRLLEYQVVPARKHTPAQAGLM